MCHITLMQAQTKLGFDYFSFNLLQTYPISQFPCIRVLTTTFASEDILW